MSLNSSRTTLRRATDEDAERLVVWHDHPEVARFWDGERFTISQMRERLHRNDVDAWIVEVDEEPVGYLQSWRHTDEADCVGLDGFLIPGARGKGFMPDAARTLAHALLSEGRTSVTVDPAAWNRSSLRCWTKAGFVEVSRHPADSEHSAPWVLMQFEPAATATSLAREK